MLTAMSIGSRLRDRLGLQAGKGPWGLLLVTGVLLAAGWLLQERVSAPDPFELEYSALCKFIDDGKVEMLVIEGQSVDGDFSSPQAVAGHRTSVFRTTVPLNDPSFLPLLHDKHVRVRVIAARPGIPIRFLIAAVPLALFLGMGLWASRRPNSVSAR